MSMPIIFRQRRMFAIDPERAETALEVALGAQPVWREVAPMLGAARREVA